MGLSNAKEMYSEAFETIREWLTASNTTDPVTVGQGELMGI